MAARSDRGNGQRQICLLFDDFDCGANRAGCSQLFVSRQSVTVGMFGGEQEPAHQAVGEWLSDERLMEQAVGPEKLLA